jgi:hypothetical protein
VASVQASRFYRLWKLPPGYREIFLLKNLHFFEVYPEVFLKTFFLQKSFVIAYIYSVATRDVYLLLLLYLNMQFIGLRGFNNIISVRDFGFSETNAGRLFLHAYGFTLLPLGIRKASVI